MSMCIVTNCPAWQRPVGCGWLAAGTPCRHPRWRATWEALSGERKPEVADQRLEVGLLRRAEAAAMPMTPERARQLILALEVIE